MADETSDETTWWRTKDVVRCIPWMSPWSVRHIPRADLPYNLTGGGHRRYRPADVRAYVQRNLTVGTSGQD